MGHRISAVHGDEQQVGPVHYISCPGYAYAFRGGVRLPQARRVEKAGGYAVYEQSPLQYVPGGSSLRGNYGPILAQHGVEKGAFAGVGPAQYGYARTFPHHSGGHTAGYEGIYLRPCGTYTLGKGREYILLQFLRVVYGRVYAGEQVKYFLLHLFYAAG